MANRRGVDAFLGTQTDTGVITGNTNNQAPAVGKIAKRERVLREIHLDRVRGKIAEGLLEVPLVALATNRDEVLEHFARDRPVLRASSELSAIRGNRDTIPRAPSRLRMELAGAERMVARLQLTACRKVRFSRGGTGRVVGGTEWTHRRCIAPAMTSRLPW